MTIAGNDCPECSSRLTGDRCPNCGWRGAATALPWRDQCRTCAEVRAREERPQDWRSAEHCERCGTHSKSTTEFVDTRVTEDRGLRLCPGCWIPALKRRMEADPISPEGLESCKASVQASLAQMQWRVLA